MRATDVGGIAVTADINPSDWDAYVDASPSGTGYHSWGWREVFERALGHRTLYLSALRDQRIVGVLPLVVFDSWLFGRFAVSLPFVNYGGVLADDDNTATSLLRRATDICVDRRLRYIELRHRVQRFPALRAKRHKVAMLLPLLPDGEALWNRLDRKVRNQVRKAEKSGLAADVGGEELLQDFYAVFAENMRDLGTPVLSRRFFAEMLAQFPARASVFVVREGRRPVASSITYRYRDAIEVPWASSLRSYKAAAPNMLLYWTMLRHACNGGAAIFDFGRSTPDEGTFHFKRQWGARSEPMVWEYALLDGRGALPDISPKNSRFAAAIRAWQRMPVWATRVVGPSIVRNIPA